MWKFSWQRRKVYVDLKSSGDSIQTLFKVVMTVLRYPFTFKRQSWPLPEIYKNLLESWQNALCKLHPVELGKRDRVTLTLSMWNCTTFGQIWTGSICPGKRSYLPHLSSMHVCWQFFPKPEKCLIKVIPYHRESLRKKKTQIFLELAIWKKEQKSSHAGVSMQLKRLRCESSFIIIFWGLERERRLGICMTPMTRFRSCETEKQQLVI